MVECIATIGAALVWLLYESDWLRVRLPVGPVVAFCLWTPPTDPLADARAEVAEAWANATNDYKRGVARAKERVVEIIATTDQEGGDAIAIFEAVNLERIAVIREFGERLAPYRNASRHGCKGGVAHNPYNYPFLNVPGKTLDGMYQTYEDYCINLAEALELPFDRSAYDEYAMV